MIEKQLGDVEVEMWRRCLSEHLRLLTKYYY